MTKPSPPPTPRWPRDWPSAHHKRTRELYQAKGLAEFDNDEWMNASRQARKELEHD